MFLTKHPNAYRPFLIQCKFNNIWAGATVLNNNDLTTFQDNLFLIKNQVGKTFISIEPMLEPIDVNLFDIEVIDWIIVGAQTNPLKLPELELLRPIQEWCMDNNIPLFMKHNLEPLGMELIKEFPK